MIRHAPVRRLRAILVTACLASFVLPAVVVAHAALDEATPEDGTVVQGTPTEISATYTQNLDPEGTSLKLVDASDKVIAEGIIDPDDIHRMFIAKIPDMSPGAYEVRSTTQSAEDGELDRATWHFKVESIPTPSPSPSPTRASAPSATPESSVTPATPRPTPVPSDTPTPGADDGAAGSGGDVLLPIIAAVVIVAAIAGYLFSRRDRRPAQP